MHRLPTGVTRQKLLREGSYQAAAAIASASSRRTRITRCNMQAAVRGNYGVRRRGRPPIRAVRRRLVRQSWRNGIIPRHRVQLRASPVAESCFVDVPCLSSVSVATP